MNTMVPQMERCPTKAKMGTDFFIILKGVVGKWMEVGMEANGWYGIFLFIAPN